MRLLTALDVEGRRKQGWQPRQTCLTPGTAAWVRGCTKAVYIVVVCYDHGSPRISTSKLVIDIMESLHYGGS